MCLRSYLSGAFAPSLVWAPASAATVGSIKNISLLHGASVDGSGWLSHTQAIGPLRQVGAVRMRSGGDSLSPVPAR